MSFIDLVLAGWRQRGSSGGGAFFSVEGEGDTSQGFPIIKSRIIAAKKRRKEENILKTINFQFKRSV